MFKFTWLCKSMKSTFYIFLLFIFNNSFAQPGLVTIKIWVDSTKTTGTVAFHCTITNPTNNNYKFFGYLDEWERKVYPNCWDIKITKDTSSFIDLSWEYVLIKYARDPIIRLDHHSSIKYNFILDFSKLSRWKDLSNLGFHNNMPHDSISEIITRFRNQNFGLYTVQIKYLKEYFDPQNPITLESNCVQIEYKKSNSIEAQVFNNGL